MAKELGWSQRELIERMSIEEMIDWMAYERSTNDEFKKRQKQRAIVAKNKDEESDAIRALFASLAGDNK